MGTEGKYAIVTGAASGMGRCHALELAAKGYNLVLVDINGKGLEEVSREISGRKVICIEQDLASENASGMIASRVRDAGAEVEVLVNNAGMLFVRTVAETDPEKLRAMMMLHCVTPLLLCREFIPSMTAAGKGYILNISSITAWMDWPAIGMYGNTKRFVKGYSRSLRIECRGTGVSVTTAIFGAVDTKLFGFSEKARKAMLATGIMIPPEVAVKKAQEAMLQGRRRVFPGILNKIAVPVLKALPDGFLSFSLRQARRYLEGCGQAHHNRDRNPR